MGNMKPIDSAVVKNETYDVLSADTMGGEYIETIGAACQNPDGYTSGSLFLGKDNDVQHLYRATAAIAFGETIILDTNCTYTTVSGELEGKAEESEVSSLNEALTNEVATRAANGAHNLLPSDNTTQVINGVTFTVNNSTGVITTSGTASAATNFNVNVNSVYLEENKEYIVTSNCGVANLLYLNNSHENFWETDVARGIRFTANSSDPYRVIIHFNSGFNANGLTFKPMIRLASDADPTYQPYAMTNRELTDDISTIKGMPYDLLASASATVNNVTIPNINQYRYIIASCGLISSKNSLINPVMIPVSLFKKLANVYSGYSGTSAGSVIVLSMRAIYISDTSISIDVNGSTDALVYGVK